MRIASSLAAAPFTKLGQTILDLEAAGVDYVHFDVEDGSFVPCMTLGTRILQELRPLTRLPFDVHLMMVNPEWLLPDLARMGANRVSVHYEACPYPRRTLRMIAELGMTAGLAFNPITPIPDLRYLEPYLFFLVLLSTEPEIPDAPYLPRMLEKLRGGKAQSGLRDAEWVLDGGVGQGNIKEVRQAGADTIVIGRSLFQGDNIRENVRALRTLATA